jgi:DNA polymerase-3 subunit delta'
MAFSVEQASGYLREAFAQGRLAHTFLFTGPDGSGKRRLVADFFQIVNGETSTSSDLHVIEPESKSRKILVDQIRDLEGALRMRATRARSKFGVVYEADRLMPQAANAFLKTLEEPPEHSILILVTTLPEVLLDTIRSRCIEVTLFRAGKKRPTPDESAAVNELYNLIFATGFSVVTALKYARVFLGLLAKTRERIETEHAELLARDQSAYKQTTDGSWLGEREERLTALTESRYVKARADLILKLIEALGDALRFKFESRHLDLEDYRSSAARLAERISSDELLARIGALQSVMDSLSRNVQETLAIEVAFMVAFGPVPENLGGALR